MRLYGHESVARPVRRTAIGLDSTPEALPAQSEVGMPPGFSGRSKRAMPARVGECHYIGRPVEHRAIGLGIRPSDARTIDGDHAYVGGQGT
jgi:hypothetical protein